QIGQGLIFGHPAPVNLITNDQLVGLVEEVDNDVLAKIGECNLRIPAERPDFVCPIREGEILRKATFQGDWIELAEAGRLTTGARIASLPVFNHRGGAFQAAYLADSGHVSPIPLHSELEILIGVETSWIRSEFSHTETRHQRVSTISLA